MKVIKDCPTCKYKYLKASQKPCMDCGKTKNNYTKKLGQDSSTELYTEINTLLAKNKKP